MANSNSTERTLINGFEPVSVGESSANALQNQDLTQAGCTMSRLTWRGDNIGLQREEDVDIQFRDAEMPNGVWHVSLSTALPVADRIDSYGLKRIALSLAFAAQHGLLSSSDAATWQAHEPRIAHLLEVCHE
ncbi:hypothetical protein R69608_00352 [Paraburkholderia nemoris]|uniref:hypothetical protein n=1 Tax=Paraburkholderia nemoris TaxID=2793076 RepID=UPI0019133E53|nr:hypothetical protein [Paraburkholderia nemoris]MBK5146376.1 hypothetical protein [Burkholderia sp. R-69608]CAE6863903.1 hypothetical protein R69608_00352 [Paraburkholderia nemoris]